MFVGGWSLRELQVLGFWTDICEVRMILEMSFLREGQACQQALFSSWCVVLSSVFQRTLITHDRY